MQKQTVTFSRTLSCLTLVGLLIFSFSANSAVGQIRLDGEQVSSPFTNFDFVNNASVRDATLGNRGIIRAAFVSINGVIDNWGNAMIGTAQVSTLGMIDNRGDAMIGTANVVGLGGRIDNSATIGTANVDTGGSAFGTIDNRGNATIRTANVVSGEMTNMDNTIINTANIGSQNFANIGFGYMFNTDNSIIGTTNVYDFGYVSNMGDATIHTANVFGGHLVNRHDATVGTANVGRWGSGSVANLDNGIIDTVLLDGGVVLNANRINNMTYTGGTYHAQFEDRFGNTYTGGSIGTLTLAGDATGIDWGDVDHIRFDSNGNGILHIAAFIETEANGFGIQAMTANSSPEISFIGINAQSVDLTNGRVVIDTSRLGNYEENLLDSLFADQVINLAALFGADVVTGVERLESFEIGLGGDTFFVVSNGVLAEGWILEGYNAIPEPATLAIIGLGLAGLGLARRRVKNKPHHA